MIMHKNNGRSSDIIHKKTIMQRNNIDNLLGSNIIKSDESKKCTLEILFFLLFVEPVPQRVIPGKYFYINDFF